MATEWHAGFKGFPANNFMNPRLRKIAEADLHAASLKSAALPEPTEKVFVHQLNRTSADVRRREKEKQMVEEEKDKIRTQREITKRQKEEERKRDMEMLRTFNPWGKPGAGAPPDDPKRKKHFEDTAANEEQPIKFGQPGAGAPNRSKSGRIRTQLAGDPDIRFQDGQQVRLSIENHLRYKNFDKENYRNQLDNIIEAKQLAKSQEKEMDRKNAEEMEKMYPFGRSKENGGSPIHNSEPLFLSTNPVQKKEEVNEDYSPWGKGYGNPGRDDRGNVLRHAAVRSKEVGIPDPPPPEEDLGLVLPLYERRGGNGEPHRTKSGNLRTRLKKTLESGEQYGNVVAEEGNAQSPEDGYYPFGKPGAGAPFTREAGKSFLEKMGWSSTEEKTMRDAKQDYLNTLKSEMEEKRQRDKLERERLREKTTQFVDVLKEKESGNPKKDPITGEMKRVPRNTSDVTSQKLDIRRTRNEMSSEYNKFLRQQTEQKQQIKQKEKQKEQEEIQEHQNKWDSFWGKPGNGAPRENNKKENLSTLLYSSQGGSEPYVKHYTTEVVPSKHKNHYEVSSKDPSNIITKDYEFKTPYPAMT